MAQCDCERLPFDDNTFDLACVSFGLRNMTHKDRALREMTRVVRPGGRVVVLEFSHCQRWLKPFYDSISLSLCRGLVRRSQAMLRATAFGRVDTYASESGKASWHDAAGRSRQCGMD